MATERTGIRHRTMAEAALDASARRVPLRALRGLALALARAADPPGLGELRALPRRTARAAGLVAGPPPGDRPAAPRGLRRARPRAGGRRAVPAPGALR